jgi:hypothetical protein
MDSFKAIAVAPFLLRVRPKVLVTRCEKQLLPIVSYLVPVAQSVLCRLEAVRMIDVDQDNRISF